MLLGVIGDDFTGSSDIGNVLTRGGMNTALYVGRPGKPVDPGIKAGVVALKTRSIPVEAAVAQSLDALEWLLAQGCGQIVFKYCSTFDSTPQGNIGPVAVALADRLEAETVLVCPAFPAAGRCVFQGHLFVGGSLLSESGMQNHPLTPMTDPDLRRWLALQVAEPVGHIPAQTVHTGVPAVVERIADQAQRGCRLLIADAIEDTDLLVLGQAAADHRLITGGSGIALGLVENFRSRQLVDTTRDVWAPQTEGKAAILSGSCSKATRRQVELYKGHAPARFVDIDELMEGSVSANAVVDWALEADGVPLIYTSSDPETVSRAQEKHGWDQSSERVESFFAEIARKLVDGGVTRLITAGGETSGAVVEGLELERFVIGPEIDPGVPALRAREDLTLVLKSGNFGSDDFFAKADAVLSGIRL